MNKKDRYLTVLPDTLGNLRRRVYRSTSIVALKLREIDLPSDVVGIRTEKSIKILDRQPFAVKLDERGGHAVRRRFTESSSAKS